MELLGAVALDTNPRTWYNYTMTDNDRACIAAARLLLQSALSCLDSESPESAIWRCADAAGLVASVLTPDQRTNLIGFTQHTGRGYRVVQR